MRLEMHVWVGTSTNMLRVKTADEIPILPSGYLDLHRQCINKQTMKTMHISASTTQLHIITKKNDNISIDSTLTGSMNARS